MKDIKSTHVMAILSEAGFAYLTEQAKAVEANYGVGSRIGKSGLLRGVCDGFAATGMQLSDCPTPERIAAKVKAELTRSNRKRGTK